MWRYWQRETWSGDSFSTLANSFKMSSNLSSLSPTELSAVAGSKGEALKVSVSFLKSISSLQVAYLSSEKKSIYIEWREKGGAQEGGGGGSIDKGGGKRIREGVEKGPIGEEGIGGRRKE